MKLVGEILKDKREPLKLNIENICFELKISSQTIKELENDNIKNDTQLVFIMGHLRVYASYLNLDPNEISEKFKTQYSINKNKISSEIPKPFFDSSHTIIKKSAPVFLISIIFVSFYVLFIKNDNKSLEYALVPELPEVYNPIVEEYNVKNEITNTKLTEKLDNNDKYSDSSAVASLSSDQNIESIETITLKFLNSTWLQLRDTSNNIILSKLMEKNEEYSYDLKLNYNITSGNAGNILVIINNDVRGRIGKIGEVIDSFIIDQEFNN